MSRLTGYFSARKRTQDSAPMPEPEPDSREDHSRDDVFDLIPPRPANVNAAEDAEAAHVADPDMPFEAGAGGRNVHPIAMTDLSRLSIDNDGRLYWDGKPVEVRRRILMSRPQIVGASIIALFVVIGAVGAAVHGSAAALDWACRLSWTANYCPLPDATPPPPPPRPDIPA